MINNSNNIQYFQPMDNLERIAIPFNWKKEKMNCFKFI